MKYVLFEAFRSMLIFSVDKTFPDYLLSF